jgi:hypothetical protein
LRALEEAECAPSWPHAVFNETECETERERERERPIERVAACLG